MIYIYIPIGMYCIIGDDVYQCSIFVDDYAKLLEYTDGTMLLLHLQQFWEGSLACPSGWLINEGSPYSTNRLDETTLW